MTQRLLNIHRMLDVRRTLGLVWHSARGWTIANGALSAVQGLLPLLSLYLMKCIVDAVTAGLAHASSASLTHVGLLVAGAAGAALLSVLCSSAAGLVQQMQTQTVTDYVTEVLHAKSLEADLEYYETPQYYDTLHMAQQEAPYRPISIVTSLAQFGQNFISILAITGLLFSFHWAVALILLVAALPGTWVRFRYAGRMYRWQRERTPTERQSSYFNWLLTGDAHAKEIRLFDMGHVFMRRFSGLRRQLRIERMQLATSRALMEFAAQTCATIAIFGCFLFVAARTFTGSVSLGNMVMFFMAFQRGQSALRDLLGSLATIYENNLFIAHFYQFLDLTPKVRQPASPRLPPTPIRKGIVLDHVHFRYAGGTRQAVEDVSLSIEPGEHVALVGENGSGKTTLVKLLCRLYDPEGGRITVDGIDLREMTTQAWRRQISVIFQDFARYHLSVRENIWLGNVEIPPQDPRVEAAAALSGADAVIRSLPRGFDTPLGKWFANGEELSVGQWQEVALARAFLRDAQLIILDEPTSALDAKAEFEIFQKFHALARHRSAILISHRMSTVRMADRIFVLAGGRVSESGSHAELLARGGLYAQMFEMQARNYR